MHHCLGCGDKIFDSEGPFCIWCRDREFEKLHRLEEKGDLCRKCRLRPVEKGKLFCGKCFMGDY